MKVNTCFKFVCSMMLAVGLLCAPEQAWALHYEFERDVKAMCSDLKRVTTESKVGDATVTEYSFLYKDEVDDLTKEFCNSGIKIKGLERFGIPSGIVEKSVTGRSPFEFETKEPVHILISASSIPTTRTRAAFLDLETGQTFEAEWMPLAQGGAGLSMVLPRGSWRFSMWSSTRIIENRGDVSWKMQYAFLKDVEDATPDTIFGYAFVSDGPTELNSLTSILPGATSSMHQLEFRVMRGTSGGTDLKELFQNEQVGLSALAIQNRSTALMGSIANELLFTLTTVIVNKAREGAMDLLKNRVLTFLNCEEEPSHISRFDATCDVLDFLSLRQISTATEPLIEAIRRDIVHLIIKHLNKQKKHSTTNIDEIVRVIRMVQRVQTVVQDDKLDDISKIMYLLGIVDDIDIFGNISGGKSSVSPSYIRAASFVYICQKAGCTHQKLNDIMRNHEKWFDTKNICKKKSPKDCLATEIVAEDVSRIAHMMFTVVDPSADVLMEDRLINTVPLMLEACGRQCSYASLGFDVENEIDAEIAAKEKLSELLSAIIVGDLIKTLIHARPIIELSLCGKDKPEDASRSEEREWEQCQYHVEQALSFAATFSTLAEHQEGLSESELEARRAARADLLEKYVNTATRRIHRDRDVIVGLWGGFELGYMTNAWAGKNNRVPVQPIRIPVGVALHWPFQAAKHPSVFTASLTPLDLGGYLQFIPPSGCQGDGCTTEGSINDFEVGRVVQPAFNVGWMISYDIPIYFSVFGLYHLEHGWAAGGSIGYSVPLWDFN